MGCSRSQGLFSITRGCKRPRSGLQVTESTNLLHEEPMASSFINLCFWNSEVLGTVLVFSKYLLHIEGFPGTKNRRLSIHPEGKMGEST